MTRGRQNELGTMINCSSLSLLCFLFFTCFTSSADDAASNPTFRRKMQPHGIVWHCHSQSLCFEGRSSSGQRDSCRSHTRDVDKRLGICEAGDFDLAALVVHNQNLTISELECRLCSTLNYNTARRKQIQICAAARFDTSIEEILDCNGHPADRLKPARYLSSRRYSHGHTPEPGRFGEQSVMAHAEICWRADHSLRRRRKRTGDQFTEDARADDQRHCLLSFGDSVFSHGAYRTRSLSASACVRSTVDGTREVEDGRCSSISLEIELFECSPRTTEGFADQTCLILHLAAHVLEALEPATGDCNLKTQKDCGGRLRSLSGFGSCWSFACWPLACILEQDPVSSKQDRVTCCLSPRKRVYAREDNVNPDSAWSSSKPRSVLPSCGFWGIWDWVQNASVSNDSAAAWFLMNRLVIGTIPLRTLWATRSNPFPVTATTIILWCLLATAATSGVEAASVGLHGEVRARWQRHSSSRLREAGRSHNESLSTAFESSQTFVESSAPLLLSTTRDARGSAATAQMQTPTPTGVQSQQPSTAVSSVPMSTSSSMSTNGTNQSSYSTPSLCPASGTTWIETESESACGCAPGYSGDNQSCVACGTGSYKNFSGNGNCTLCSNDTWPSGGVGSVREEATCLPCPPPSFTAREAMDSNGFYVNFVSVSVSGSPCLFTVFAQADAERLSCRSRSLQTSTGNASVVVLTQTTTLRAIACHWTNRSGATASHHFKVAAGPQVEVTMTLGGDLQVANMTQRTLRVFEASIADLLAVHAARVMIDSVSEASRRLLALSMRVRILASSSADAGFLVTKVDQVSQGVEQAAAALGFDAVTVSGFVVVISIPVIPRPATTTSIPSPTDDLPVITSPPPRSDPAIVPPETMPASTSDDGREADRGDGPSLGLILGIVLPILLCIAVGAVFVFRRRALAGTVARGPRVLPPPPPRRSSSKASQQQQQHHMMPFAQAAAVFSSQPEPNPYAGVGSYQQRPRQQGGWGLQLDTQHLTAFHPLAPPGSPSTPPPPPNPPRSHSPYVVSNYHQSGGRPVPHWMA